MIVELTVLLVAAATGALAARKLRRPAPRPLEPVASRATPIGTGDALVLDAGSGAAWSLSRTLVFREGEADPFLYLFEADTDAEGVRVIAWEPAAPELVGLLREVSLSGAPLNASSLVVEVEGAELHVRTRLRRTATAVGDGPGMLHVGTGSVTVLSGDDRAQVVLLGAGERPRALAGRTRALATLSVLSSQPLVTRPDE